MVLFPSRSLSALIVLKVTYSGEEADRYEISVAVDDFMRPFSITVQCLPIERPNKLVIDVLAIETKESIN